MREILFRGKRKDGNGWVYGHYHNTTYIGYPNGGDNKTTEHYILPQNAMNACAVIPETVGQYTGLCDKNGKKIFEGDIVQYWGSYPLEIYIEKGHTKTRWFDSVTNREYTELFFGYDEESYGECEIIGNIHDNPELLED